MRHYFIIFSIAAVLTGLSLAGFNWLVDPYWIFGAPKIAGFNAYKTRLDPNERIFKIVNLARQQPTVVLLGTSRTDVGLSPLHPVFAGKKTLNLAMSAQPYSETRALLDLLDQKKTRQAIIGMDFFVANDLLIPPRNIVSENYSSNRRLELLISISTLRDSIMTLIPVNQLTAYGLNEYTDAGQRGYNIKAPAKGNHGTFISNERGYLLDMYTPPPNCTFEFDTLHHGQSQMDHARAMLERAYRENIDLRLFISPSHARQWETLAAAGLWDKWEEWKRRLTKMNEDEAEKAKRPAFPIWDFSGYNSISTETLPTLDDATNLMRNYFDSSHYTPTVGNLVLDRIFSYHTQERNLPDDFGVLITSANLNTHLARIRAEREQYRRTHPGDVAEINALAMKVANEKHCKRGLRKSY